jgi:hypothetical protein
MKRKKIVFYFYNRLLDPLLQSNIFLYIHNLATENRYEIAIITYEDPQHPLSSSEQASIHEKFKAQHIVWHPLVWHRGTSIKLKIQDLISGFFLLFKLRLQGYRHLVSLGSLAGSFAYVACVLLRVKLFLYQYEPHSEYAVDNGIWLPGSRQFKLLHSLEKRSALFSTIISTGTQHMLRRLESWNVKAALYKIPSVANDSLFVFSATKREEVRQSLRIPSSSKVIVYAGKFGGLYFAQELIQVFSLIQNRIPDTFFLLVTTQETEALLNWCNTYQMDPLRYRITSAVYSEMPGILSACDLGIVSVRPGQSSVFRSNIKVGEYLCTGLPYLVCEGVSEDDLYAKKDHVGVVVADFTPEALNKVLPEIETFLSEDLKTRISRCRKTGMEYRGLSWLNPVFGKAIAELVGN